MKLRILWRGLAQRARLEREMDQELRFHLEARTEDLVRSGMAPAEAERRARMEFGGMDRYKETSREALGLRWWDEARSDLRYAVRVLRRSPAFTASAVCSLGLGIGANLAIFTVLDAALVRPLPFREPDRLVALYEDHVTRGAPLEEFSAANFFDLRSSNAGFEDLAAHAATGVSIANATGTEQVGGGMVTANAFAVLGVKAALGRTLLAEDGEPGGSPVVVLSHRLWLRKFGADPSVVGRAVRLEGGSHSVVGVMPSWFRLPLASNDDEFWVPARFSETGKQERSNHNWRCFGRLKAGVSVAQAQSQISTVASRLRNDYSETNAGIDFRVQSLRDALSGGVKPALLVLMAAVLFVLLAACANVGSLVLARAVARRKEVAVRAALGASPWRLARQILAETVLVSTLGGAAAAAALAWTFPAVAGLLPDDWTPVHVVALDSRAIVVAFLLAIATGIVCASGPILLLAREQGPTTHSSATRTATAGSLDLRMRSALVGAEAAVTVVLLVGLALLGQSFYRLLRVDLGVRTDHVVSVRFVLPRYLYREHGHRMDFYRRLLEKAGEHPAVESAGLITTTPFTSEGGSSWFTIEGRPSAHPEELLANNRTVSIDYFRTMGIPLRRGRLLGETDARTGAALINEAMALRFWRGEDPVGKRFKFGGPDSDKPWIEIAGVVGSVRQGGPHAEAKPEIYRLFSGEPALWLAPRALVARVRSRPEEAVELVRRLVRDTDPEAPIYASGSLGELVAGTVAARRTGFILLAAFGVVGLSLAAVGIYGVVAYSASRRGREIAVRLALGAVPGSVVGLILRRELTPVAAGGLAGVLLSIGLTRFLTSQLYEVTPTDPATFGSVTATVALVALAAAYLPARRASRLGITALLRQE